jgi:hypothetical protein
MEFSRDSLMYMRSHLIDFVNGDYEGTVFDRKLGREVFISGDWCEFFKQNYGDLGMIPPDATTIALTVKEARKIVRILNRYLRKKP